MTATYQMSPQLRHFSIKTQPRKEGYPHAKSMVAAPLVFIQSYSIDTEDSFEFMGANSGGLLNFPGWWGCMVILFIIIIYQM